MYFVMIDRVVKHNTGTTDKFSPRTANRESTRISGPFAKRTTAERALLAALATHTCLSAMVVDISYLARMQKDTSTTHQLCKEIKKVLDATTFMVEA